MKRGVGSVATYRRGDGGPVTELVNPVVTDLDVPITNMNTDAACYRANLPMPRVDATVGNANADDFRHATIR